MRFLHIGDIHLGAGWRGLPSEKGRARAKELFATLDKALDLALREKVDAILIAGDLFDSPNPAFNLVQEVKYRFGQFSTTTGLQVLIAPGNHDPWVCGSPYASQWPENVTVFDESWRGVQIKEILIRGFGFERHLITNCPLQQGSLQDADILLLHADWQGSSVSPYAPIQPAQLAELKARYTALGHIHKAGVVWERDGRQAVYAGSLEPLGWDEPGQHGVWLGEIRGGELKLDFVPLASREVKIIPISVDNCQAREEFARKILSSVPPEERRNYCLIRWTGEIDPRLNIPLELKEIEQDFFALRLESEARPAYNLDELAALSLRGAFAAEMQKLLADSNPEQREELELALWYGLDALTWGRVMER